MSTEETRAIARRFLDEFWSQGNSAVADEIIAPDYAVYDPGTPGRRGGVEGEKQCLAMYRRVFPDLRFTIEDIIAEGDRGVVRWTASGTQQGELMGAGPTGKQAVISGISIVRVANGQIAEHWLNWDTVGMLQQLGLLPAPAQS